ncbi:MAG: hypothetical protein RMI91_08790 [Gemmatales bacterium]|nr:hypothetical protein [Gemmatales bacterium]MDW7994736.1 hypothetical protein [Gemmatales bacterium]
MKGENITGLGLATNISAAGCMTFSPDGLTLAAAVDPQPLPPPLPGGGTVTPRPDPRIIGLWDTRTGAFIRYLDGHRQDVNCLRFSPEGELLASGSVDQTVCIWEVSTGEMRTQLRGHEGVLADVIFTAANEVRTVAQDGTVRRWNLRVNSSQILPLEVEGQQISGIGFVNSRQVLMVTTKGEVSLWDLDPLRRIRHFTIPEMAEGLDGLTFPRGGNFTSGLLISPDGNHFALRSWVQSQEWILADSRTGKPLTAAPTTDANEHGIAITALAFSRDGAYLASGDAEGKILIWQLQPEPRLVARAATRGAPVASLDFVAAPDTLAIALTEFRRLSYTIGGVPLKEAPPFRLFNWKETKDISRVELPPRTVQRTCLSSDGRFATYVELAQPVVVVLDLITRVEVARCRVDIPNFRANSLTVLDIALHPSGKYVALATPQGIHVYQLSDGALVWDSSQDPGDPRRTFSVCSLAWSFDGQRLAAGTFETVYFYRPFAKEKSVVGQAFYRPPYRPGIVAAPFRGVFLPGTEVFLAGAPDGQIVVLDAATGKLLSRRAGHSLPVSAIALSRDRQHLATGSEDCSILIWDVAELLR